MWEVVTNPATRPQLGHLKEESSDMMSTILKTSRLAEGISDKVRQIDLEQVIGMQGIMERSKGLIDNVVKGQRMHSICWRCSRAETMRWWYSRRYATQGLRCCSNSITKRFTNWSSHLAWLAGRVYSGSLLFYSRVDIMLIDLSSFAAYIRKPRSSSKNTSRCQIHSLWHLFTTLRRCCGSTQWIRYHALLQAVPSHWMPSRRPRQIFTICMQYCKRPMRWRAQDGKW